MARLPYSRVVDVTLTKLDRFATRRGFGVPLILTSDIDSGSPVDGTTRTKVYGSIDEVAEDWADTTEAYKCANAMFSQNPRPRQVKIGYVNPGVFATTPSPTVTAELNAVYAFDNDWYFLVFTEEFRDLDLVDDIFDWVESKSKLCLVDSNDSGTESSANTTSVAARNKGAYKRSGVFYHPTAAEYPAAAIAAVASRFDLDQPDSAYTAKFKYLAGITPANKASSAVQGATGFVPAIGLSTAAGHLANMYVNIGGIYMVVEGTMLDGGFIDELHFADWLIARTEEELLSTLANQPGRVPYTNAGMQLLVGAVEGVMQRAVSAGAIADRVNVEGDLEPAYDITVERVEDIPASQRRQRVAPPVDCKFRYAGAVHYAAARFLMTF